MEFTKNLPKLIGKSLPKKFVLKCTHGCGFNIICNDKEKLDKNQTLKQLDEWMRIRLDKCPR